MNNALLCYAVPPYLSSGVFFFLQPLFLLAEYGMLSAKPCKKMQFQIEVCYVAAAVGHGVLRSL